MKNCQRETETFDFEDQAFIIKRFASLFYRQTKHFLYIFNKAIEVSFVVFNRKHKVRLFKHHIRSRH